MSGLIRIEGFRVLCHLGVPAEERAREQEIIIDAELSLDLGRAAASDDVRDTVDYAAVCRTLHDVARQRAYCLIETMAATMASEALRAFPLERVRIRVTKPAALRDFIGAVASVEIERTRNG
ncbi:MAG TPA: dihydroneopterin aldolase [Terriglobia bacterium]|nr:dihydroneopterin aldolase [Terriglobia bacterium]